MAIQVFTTLAAFRHYRATLPPLPPLPPGNIPFVPTMGALHEGHASLVRHARSFAGSTGTVLTSIFVNPTQFAPHEDFAQYPRTLEADIALLEQAGATALFAPTAEEMYPVSEISNSKSQISPLTTIHPPPPLASVLEGAIRPTHFAGVCTVVAKLLHITQPTHLILGQKDYQQQAVVRQMIRDLDFPVELVVASTVREPDGLAMSSRNRYLNPADRARAATIYQALIWAQSQFTAGNRNAEALNSGMKDLLTAQGLEVQYALACHPDTLAPLIGTITPPAVLLIAAKLGATRLIDNLLLKS